MRDISESRLIERAKAHDAEALSELYRRHANAIFRYVYYRVGDQAVAEDMVGEVFVRALEGLASYRDIGRPFEAWLYRIGQARVVDHYRQQTRPHLPQTTTTALAHIAVSPIQIDSIG